jgi:hypothetical protein
MQKACQPHVITRALGQLFNFEDIRPVASPDPDDGLPYCPCKLIGLSEATPSDLNPILDHRIYLETIYAEHSERRRGKSTIGRAAETAVRRAFELSRQFTIGHSWGDVRDPLIVGAADGLLFSPDLPRDRAGILVEVKNWREWIYHDEFRLWKHIRNAYAMDYIPVFVARRIYPKVFEYVFKRLGGLGVEMRAQYAPPSFKEALADVVDPDGLDYYDLRFTTDPGPRFCKRIRDIAQQVSEARMRLERARPIATPFVERLAKRSCRNRSAIYWELQAALNTAGIEPLSLERPDEAQV